MKSLKTITLSFSIILFCQSCFSNRDVGDFSIISTENVNVGGKYVKVVEGAEGRDYVHYLFIFIPICYVFTICFCVKN